MKLENKHLTTPFPMNLEKEWLTTFEKMDYSGKNWLGRCMTERVEGAVFEKALTIVRDAIETELEQRAEEWFISEVPVYEPHWSIVLFWNEHLKKEIHIGIFVDNEKQEVTLKWLYYDEAITDCEAATLKEAYEKNVNV